MRLPRAIGLIALAAVMTLGGPMTAAGAAKKCKAGQIRVKQGKKSVCRPFASTFPRPRAGDPRLLFLRSALDFTPKARYKRGFARRGKKARKAMLRALPKALARIDKLAPGRAPHAFGERRLKAECSDNGPDLGQSGFTDGGVDITTSFRGNGMGMTITFSTGGYSFRVEYFTTVGCGDLSPPACPTAGGAADARAIKLDRVRIEVRKDGQVISSQGSTVRRETTTHGQVAADAKLDFVVVDDAVSMNTSVNGQSLNGTITRHTRINMRTDTYERARAGRRSPAPSRCSSQTAAASPAWRARSSPSTTARRATRAGSASARAGPSSTARTEATTASASSSTQTSARSSSRRTPAAASPRRRSRPPTAAWRPTDAGP
jgi:hypothetical protein